jgi:hypothetical protein
MIRIADRVPQQVLCDAAPISFHCSKGGGRLGEPTNTAGVMRTLTHKSRGLQLDRDASRAAKGWKAV